MQNIVNMRNPAVQILCIIVFAIVLQMRVNFIHQKEGLHEDEVLSLIISNCSNYGYKMPYDENVAYTGKQLKELSFGNSTSWIDAFSDVGKLYLDNNDRPHTNLFYSCLRLWFAKTTKTNLKTVIEHGCRLNLLFFLFSFLFMYKLLHKLFNPGIIIPFSLFIAFTKVGSISNTMLMRPYQLQETLLILFTYSFVQCYDSIENEISIANSTNFYKLVFIWGLTLMSGYFASIYMLMLLGVLAFFCWKNGQEENLKFIGFLFMLAILLARMLFRGFFFGYSCGRAGEAYKLFYYDKILSNISASTGALYDILQDHLFNIYIIGAAFVIVAVCALKINKPKKAPIVFLSCFVWSFIVIFLAPFKELRYIMACFPLTTLIFPFIISHLQGAFKYGAIAVSLFYEMLLLNSAKIENLFVGQSKDFEFFTKKNLPVLMVYKDPTTYSHVLHHLPDAQIYEFPKTTNSLEAKLRKHGAAIVIFSNSYTAAEIQDMLPKNFRATFLGETKILTAYEVISNKT